MEEKISVVQIGGVMLIGIWKHASAPTMTGTGCDVLSSPRVFRVGPQDGTGRASIDFLPIIGSPKEMHIGQTTLWYDVHDENIIQGYKEAVTGLTLAKVIPALELMKGRGN